MATSGTFGFSPQLGELTLFAFGLCGVRRTAILAEHMVDARMAANLMQLAWSNEGVNLWTVDLEETTLVDGTATYAVDPTTIMILDAYIRIETGSPLTPQDRPILPVSRSEYASYPNKTMEGFPTVYWFDRLVSPTITVWPVPDGSATYYLRYYRYRQIQDADLIGGIQPEIQVRFTEAYAYGMASRLALIYAPTRYSMLEQVAKEKFQLAAKQDVEDVAFSLTPGVRGYYAT